MSNLALLCALAMQLAVSMPADGQSAESVTPADWYALKKAGDASFGVNNYGEAERSFQAALKLSDKFGPRDLRLAETLHALATLYSTRGQFGKAEPLYERELRVREKALGSENPAVIACVGKLAQFYLAHGSSQKADRLTNLLITFADKKLHAQQNVNDELNKLDGYYQKSKGFSDAQNLLAKLQDETQRTTANENLELATTLDTLAHAYQSRSNYTLAEKMYKAALSFRQHALSPDHMALAMSYDNLGTLYQAQGKKEEAEQYFKRALEVTEKTVQPGGDQLFKRIDELAQSQLNLGQKAQAEALYKRALLAMEKNANRADIGKASMALGSLYMTEGRCASAEPLFKRALVIAESLNGPQHVSLAPILESYADACERLKKTGEAARLRARARSIRGVTVEKAQAESGF